MSYSPHQFQLPRYTLYKITLRIKLEADRNRRKLWGTRVDSAGSASDTASGPKATVATAPLKSPTHNKPHVHSPSTISIDGNSDKENGGHVPHMICMPDPPCIHNLSTPQSICPYVTTIFLHFSLPVSQKIKPKAYEWASTANVNAGHRMPHPTALSRH